MISLRNIKNEDTLIEADAYLLGTDKSCHICIDKQTDKVVSPVCEQYFYGINHAFKELRQMAKANSSATERTLSWY